MKCPECSETTISFREWCRSPNAFVWQCPNCGSFLKASRATWRWFALGIFLLVPVLGGVFWLEHLGYLETGQSKPLLFVAMLVVLLPFGWFAYKRGGYVARR